MRYLIVLIFGLVACGQEPSTGGDRDRYYGPQPAIRVTHPGGTSLSLGVYSFSASESGDAPLLSAICPEGSLRCEASDVLITDRWAFSLDPGDETWSVILHNGGEGFGIAFDSQLGITDSWGYHEDLSDEDCGREVGVTPGSYNFESEIAEWRCIVIN